MLYFLGSKLKFIGLSSFSLVMILGLANFAHSQEDWKKEWGKTLDAAKKEGQVTVYIAQVEPALAAFRKQYPEIKLVTVTGRAFQIVNRIFSERRAGKYIPDVSSNGQINYSVLHKAKVLDPIKPMLVLPEVLDRSKWWGGKHIYLDHDAKYVLAYVGVPTTAFSYNTNLVDSSEFKSHWDFLNPKWKGKIISHDPSRRDIGTALSFLYQHPALGPEFMRRLFGGMDIHISRNFRQMVDWLAQGKFAICFSCRGIRRATKQGLPVKNFNASSWKEGTYFSYSAGTLGLMNRAPHPNAAKVFINWYLSRKGQIALQTLGRPYDPLNSLRIDIPKDTIAPARSLREGAKYFAVDLTDPTPVFKLTKEIMAKKR